LRTAASAGHLEIVKLLVARGADVKGERRDGSPILAYPIGAWKAEIVAYLRAAGAELPLPSAVELGELDYAESLLREHALAEARRGDAEAALWLAVERGYTRFVAELLARGVDVNVFGRDGETLLEHIDNSIQDSPRSHLLGLRQVVCDYGGLTGACLVSPLPDFAAEAKARRVRFGRLDYWPDSRTMADSRGKATPFVDPQAAWLHELQTAPVEQIAERLNSDPGLAKRGAMDDVSPLHVAAASGRMEVARILVANGADVNRISDQYGTPLHQAVREHRVEIVGWLLTRKADVNASLATTGLTPLHLAAALGHAETVQLLLDAGADPKLVLRGYKPRFETPPDGLTPLVLAAGAGKLEAVQRLYSVVTDDRADDDRKAWAMRWAADRGQRAVVEWLLVRGAPCDMVTALWGVDEAARKDPKEVAWRAAAVVARSRLPAACELGTLSELREYAAAQPTRLAYWGKEFEGVPVPLGYAILGNQPEIVTFLLENDVPRRSDLFRDRLASAWKLAVRLRRTEAAIAILNAGLDLKDLTLD
jgi:ankyrin repeat protein